MVVRFLIRKTCVYTTQFARGLLNHGSVDRMALDMPLMTDISHISCDSSTFEIWSN